MSVNWASIGPGNGLSPVQCQAITWTETDLLSTGHLGTNFREIRNVIQNFSSWKCVWKCRLRKWRPFCPWGDELTTWWWRQVWFVGSTFPVTSSRHCNLLGLSHQPLSLQAKLIYVLKWDSGLQIFWNVWEHWFPDVNLSTLKWHFICEVFSQDLLVVLDDDNPYNVMNDWQWRNFGETIIISVNKSPVCGHVL